MAPAPAVPLLDQLRDAKLVHIDARVIALHLLGDPVLGAAAAGVMNRLRDGSIEAQTSSMSLYQILVEVYREGRSELARRIARGLEIHAGLTLIPTTPEIAIQAAEVRAQLGGRPERAIQIATALVRGAEVYLTTGSGIRRIVGMTVINLEDHAGA